MNLWVINTILAAQCFPGYNADMSVLLYGQEMTVFISIIFLQSAGGSASQGRLKEPVNAVQVEDFFFIFQLYRNGGGE